MFARIFHPSKFRLLCSNPRCIRRRIHPGGYVEDVRERMLHYRTETFGAIRLAMLRMVDSSYYQVEQGNHHTYYCPSCFEVKIIVEWKGDIIKVYRESFDDDDLSLD